ncbi:MAG: hypothetical protein V2I33_25230 [Kangiellaceae bacterium]|jgi:hypothetical protein|nr:hypothetical protein [Kangiellaceae bacterium]
MQKWGMQRLYWVSLFCLLCNGCTTLLPTQEMSDARQAIQAAQAVNAANYSNSRLILANTRLNSAESHLAEGDMKTAREAAISAKQAAIDAHSVTVAIVRAENLLQVLKNYDAEALTTVNPLLEQAYEAADEGTVRATLYYADEAYRTIKRLLNPHFLKEAQTQLTQLHTLQSQLDAEQQALLQAAENAFSAKQGKKALELLKSLQSVLPQ